MSLHAASVHFAPAREDEFRLSERLVFVLGACAAGAVAGLAAAFSIGAVPLWGVVLLTAPLFLLALYFAGRSGLEAASVAQSWPGFAAALSMALLAAWPFAFVVGSWGAPQLWFLPAAALVLLTLSAVLWPASQRTIYRTAAQGALIACIAVHSGVVAHLGA